MKYLEIVGVIMMIFGFFIFNSLYRETYIVTGMLAGMFFVVGGALLAYKK